MVVDILNVLENKFALKYRENAWTENKILKVKVLNHTRKRKVVTGEQ